MTFLAKGYRGGYLYFDIGCQGELANKQFLFSLEI